ncbi:MAG: hypothetical protein EOO62_30160 [Hymenobacter sp.]|nr:MAG: hypothetical protein EOO62_30160 [Hymenobacter sp.]
MSKRREPTEEQRQRARDLRATLLANSALARQLVEMGEYDSINEALVACYTQGEHQEFNMFGQWIKLGYAVKRDEHCRFPVWGQPVDKDKPGAKAQADTEGEDESTRYWPTAYLFSNAQVEAKPAN